MNKKLLMWIGLGICASWSASAGLVHRYSFNDAAGSMTATDSVGGLSWSATLNGGASLDGTQLALDGVSGYAQLPGGVITNASAVTVETWATFGTQAADWARIFDFGDVDSTGKVLSDFRIEPRAPGNYVDCFFGTPLGAYVNHPQGLDNQTGVHLVVVLNPPNVLAVYTNGVLISGAPSGALPSLASFTNTVSYLGKSFYPADPYLNGSIDEFRIWNQALTQPEIEASYEAGPNNVSTNPGALKSVQLSLPLPVTTVNSSQSATLNGTYANLTNAVNLTGSSGIAYYSGNTNVLTVSSNGLVRAIAAGTTTVAATYQGFGSTQSVTVAQNYLAPSHRYSFNDAPGSTTAADSIGGAAWNGTLFGGAVITNGQLYLDGTDSTYLGLPAQVIGNGKALTVEAWASFGVQSRDWSRLFSFGQLDAQNNPQEQFRLSPRAGGNYVDLNYVGADANHPQGWDNQTNLHIVAVANPPAGFLGIYANGVLIGQNNNTTAPLSPTPDQLSYVGKSLYPADPYLIGSVDEFRIYDGALSPDRIAIDTAAGPKNLVTNAGALKSTRLVISSPLHLGESPNASFSGDFANVTNVNLFLYGAPTIISSDTNVLTVSSSGQVTAAGTGTATLTAQFGTFQSAQAVTVVPAALTHRYSFNDTPGGTNVADSVGGSAWNGTLNGTAMLDGTNVVLEGANSYVQLPAQIIGGYSAMTIETWASFGANSKWVRLWDFGDQNSGGGGNTSAYFCPHNGGDGMQLTMFRPAAGTDVALSTNLDNVTETQIVGVYTATGMDLYLDGKLAGTNKPNLALTDVIDANSFIGKSMFNADPYLIGSVDEFRIYRGALTASQVASDFAAGPNSVPVPAPKLAISRSNTTLTISWPAGSGNYTLQSSPAVIGPWGPSGLSSTVQNGQNVATDTISASAKFYRLKTGP